MHASQGKGVKWCVPTGFYIIRSHFETKRNCPLVADLRHFSTSFTFFVFLRPRSYIHVLYVFFLWVELMLKVTCGICDKVKHMRKPWQRLKIKSYFSQTKNAIINGFQVELQCSHFLFVALWEMLASASALSEVSVSARPDYNTKSWHTGSRGLCPNNIILKSLSRVLRIYFLDFIPLSFLC